MTYPTSPFTSLSYNKRTGKEWEIKYLDLRICVSKLYTLEEENFNVFGSALVSFHRITNNKIDIEFTYEGKNGKRQAKLVLTDIFSKLFELFPFINEQDEAIEVEEEVLTIKEKCKSSVSLEECYDCMNNKKADCWIRILSKVTKTKPSLHSGDEIADKVIYMLSQATYIVVKAEPIMKQRGEGDILYRQCSSLFSNDNASIFYLNPHETAFSVIEGIKKAASVSIKNPQFEVIDHKYIRQIYKKYKSDE
ncbi:MAG: hypothetical protein WED07_06475 [Candidatus Freyarchaeum deiterrae]